MKKQSGIIISLLLLLALTLIFTACNTAAVDSTGAGSMDTVIDTSSDTLSDATDKTPPPVGTVDPDTGLVMAEKQPLTDSEKKDLYDKAAAAAENNNFRYAYGLFSRLSVEGYSDSADRAASLRGKAYASPVIVASSNNFDGFSDDAKLSDMGFLYADAQGVPRFLYAAADGENTVVRTFTPDPQLDSVVSFFSVGYYYHDVLVCIRDDGTLRAFYVKGREAGAECYGDIGKCFHCMTISSQENIDALVEELNNEKNVVKIVDGGGYMRFALLRSDGTTRFYSKGVGYNIEALSGNADNPAVDVAYNDAYGGECVLFADGTVKTSYDGSGSAFVSGLFDIHAITEHAFLLGGHAYYDTVGSVPIESLSFSEDAVCFNEIDLGKYYMTSSDGKISDEKGNAVADANSVAYICHNNGTGRPVFVINTEGKVSELIYVFSPSDTDYSNEVWYKALTEQLQKVTVRVK